MRKKIVAGNWKMNLTPHEGVQLIQKIRNGIGTLSTYFQEMNLGIIIFPPFTHLELISGSFKDHRDFMLGAQNCAWTEKGAYTGEISAEMLVAVHATHVLIGHSERRMYAHETDEMLLSKVRMALKYALLPVFCCGESLQDRQSNFHFERVKSQLTATLFELDTTDFSNIIIAYEPIWAIGTGITATPEEAQEMHAYIRKLVSQRYGEEAGNQLSILYGGSCNPQNASSLFEKQDVDGGLIGGASLQAEDFINIITSF